MHLASLLRARAQAHPHLRRSWFVPANPCAPTSTPVSGPDSDRRAFVRFLLVATAAVQTAAVTAVCSHLLTPALEKPATTSGATALEPPESWSRPAFERLRGTCFLVAGQEFLLDQVDGRSRAGLDTVSLRFRGPALYPLENQLLRFRHPAHPTIDLLVVPGSAGNGGQLYRVTICRLAPKRSDLIDPREARRTALSTEGPEIAPV